MGNYSGTASFPFEVERYVSPIDGKLLTDKEAEAFEGELDYKLLILEVKGSSYFQEGKYYGPMDQSYPDEGETEILSVIGPNDEDWSDKITKTEREKIEELIVEKAQEDDYDPPEPDYYND